MGVITYGGLLDISGCMVLVYIFVGVTGIGGIFILDISLAVDSFPQRSGSFVCLRLVI